MSLSDEYEKLLNIIDDEKNKTRKLKKEKPKEEVNESKSNKKQIDDYKNLNINDYVTKSSKSNYNSKNTEFDIDKFKSLLRKDLIDNYYRLRSYERPYISVTEVLGCKRKVYYERMKYSVNDNNLFNFPQLKIIQEVGKSVHDVLQSYYDFDELEKVLKSEYYKLKGRVDAIKNSTVFEIKTIDPYEFPIKEIRENDYNQGIIYSYILKHDYNYNIENLEVIYISRNLKDIQVLKTKVDFDLAVKFMENSKELHDSIKLSKVPSIDNIKKDECKYCHFKKYCKDEINNDSVKDKNKHINIFDM